MRFISLGKAKRNLRYHTQWRCILWLLILSLSACASVPVAQNEIVESQTTIYPPQQFKIQAKMSIVNATESFFFNVSWQQNKNQKSIRLSSVNYFWELNIFQNDSGTWVDNALIEQPLAQWLLDNHQLSLPINELKDWVFLPQNIDKNKITLVDTQPWNNKNIMKKAYLNSNNNKITIIIKQVSL